MSGSILKFPAPPKYIRNKAQIADWLRNLAELVEQDRLKTEPNGALLMFLGDENSELLRVGGITKSRYIKALEDALSKVNSTE